MFALLPLTPPVYHAPALCSFQTMSHRKFEAPRNGSLGFLPKKRTKKHRGHIRSFPKDDAAKEPHLTAFMAYKVGVSTKVVHNLRTCGAATNMSDHTAAACVAHKALLP